jgi:large subunit ribosomal protein L3
MRFNIRDKMKAILGTKIGMTQILAEDGVLVPVTLVQAGPCTITQIKTVETDGYSAVQIALGGGKNASKSVKAHVAKADKELMPRIIKEFRVDTVSEEQKVGSSFDVSIFEIGDTVKVTGTSKGKGFAGTVKRHNFATSASTHGGNGMVRRPGSIGSMYPQKVFKGKRMAGQMGAEQVTVKGLNIMLVDTENNLIGVRGAIPGAKKSLVTVVGA